MFSHLEQRFNCGNIFRTACRLVFFLYKITLIPWSLEVGNFSNKLPSVKHKNMKRKEITNLFIMFFDKLSFVYKLFTVDQKPKMNCRQNVVFHSQQNHRLFLPVESKCKKLSTVAFQQWENVSSYYYLDKSCIHIYINFVRKYMFSARFLWVFEVFSSCVEIFWFLHFCSHAHWSQVLRKLLETKINSYVIYLFSDISGKYFSSTDVPAGKKTCIYTFWSVFFLFQLFLFIVSW